MEEFIRIFRVINSLKKRIKYTSEATSSFINTKQAKRPAIKQKAPFLTINTFTANSFQFKFICLKLIYLQKIFEIIELSYIFARYLKTNILSNSLIY